jgi:selenide,water dikinase
MATLNKAAGEVFASGAFTVNALTDVTGFGLLGHLLEMARGAKVSAIIELEHLPILPGVPALAEQDVVPGGTKTNLQHVRKHVKLPQGLPVAIAHVLADAQTNGGLLAAVPDRHLDTALSKLSRAKLDSWVIGRLVKGKPTIHVA